MSREPERDRKAREAGDETEKPPERAQDEARAAGRDTGSAGAGGRGEAGDSGQRRPRTADTSDTPPEPGPDVLTGGRPATLGAILAEARQRKGLELSDISELTHVRQEYLRALEDGRYQDLPEDVYSRNYVRLYAQAAGLDPEKVLDTYSAERRRSVGMSTLEERLEKERRGEVPEADRRAGLPFGTLLPTLALVVVLVGLAVWGFNSLFFRPGRAPATGAPGSTATVTPGASSAGEQAPGDATSAVASGGGAPADGSGAGAAAAGGATAPAGQSGNAPAGVVGDAVEARTVHVSVTTTPPGASVSIDGFALPGTTPIQNVPVTAREGRVVKITMPGYQPLQRTVDLRQDRDLSYQLTPAANAAAQPAQAAADQAVTPARVAAGQIGINITARTWLEVYRSTTRNQGERLVYATVDAGKHYVFDLPVYLHVGNAAGVDIVTSDKDLGPMGSPGAVVSKAFPAP